MTITIDTWMIPLGISIVLSAWAFLMPLPQQQGDYDFGPILSGLFRVVILIIGSLLAWLLYFIIRFW